MLRTSWRRILGPAVSFCLAACAAAPRVDWSLASWSPVVARPGVSLRGLCVVDANTVWVGGSGGTLLRSLDGGAHWASVAPPDSQALDFRDVHAFDAETAVAMVAGQPARVYRTADGGRTWTVVHSDPRPAAFFDAVAFDGDAGYLLGDPIDGSFTVLRSSDRGVTWSAMVGPRAAGAEAAFAASGTCLDASAGLVRIVTGGERSRLFTSRDGAQTWTVVDLPLRQGKASQGAFGFASGSGGSVIVGGDYAAPAETMGTVARSIDGTLWSPLAAEGSPGYRSAVVWLDAASVLAVGPEGACLSVDGGRSFHAFGSTGFHAVGRGRDGAVFACGGGGRVARLVRAGG